MKGNSNGRWKKAAGFALACVAMMLAAGMEASAQKSKKEKPKVGFVRLVNLVKSEGNTQFYVNGQAVFSRGFKPGQKTGGVGFAAGSYRIQATNDEYDEADIDFEIENGQSSTIIARGLVEKDENGEIVRKYIHFLRLRNEGEPKDYRISMFSISEKPSYPIRVNEKNYIVAARQKIEVQAAKETTYEFFSGEKTIARIFTDEPGHYVIMLFDAPDGGVEASFFMDYSFSVALDDEREEAEKAEKDEEAARQGEAADAAAEKSDGS